MAKTCNSCNTNDMAVMPIAQHEKDQNRLMGIIKWLIAVIVILIVLLVGSNVGWLIYENSFEDVVITQENDDGYNNFIGNDGDITN
jgi:multisubunit Na+/H+ antiporter MnhB subunit